MRVLLLTNEFALPQNAGGVRRQLGLVEALAGRHELHLLARLREADTPPALVDELRTRLDAPVEVFPARPATYPTGPIAVAGRWGRAVRRRSPAWAERSVSAPLVARARELAPRFDVAVTLDDVAHTYVDHLGAELPFVLDKHNVLGWSRRPVGAPSPAQRLEHWLLTQWEARTVAGAGAVVVTSEDEAERLRTLYTTEPVVVPSAVPMPRRVAAPTTAAPAVVWLGDHRYAPNRDGLLRFARVWLERAPAHARLQVVGREPGDEIRELAADPRIEVLGFVEDLDAVLAGARAGVTPVWEGAGIKLKTLTLMGAGLPVAGTPVSFEGVTVTSEKDALVADGDAALADATLRLLDDDALAARLGAAAHELIVRDHTWPPLISRYDVALERATARAAGAPVPARGS